MDISEMCRGCCGRKLLDLVWVWRTPPAREMLPQRVQRNSTEPVHHICIECFDTKWHKPESSHQSHNISIPECLRYPIRWIWSNRFHSVSRYHRAINRKGQLACGNIETKPSGRNIKHDNNGFITCSIIKQKVILNVRYLRGPSEGYGGWLGSARCKSTVL